MKTIKTLLFTAILLTSTNLLSYTVINNGKEAITVKNDTGAKTETVEALQPGKSTQLYSFGTKEIYLLPARQESRLQRLGTLTEKDIPKDANTIYLTQDDKKKWSIRAVKK